jgi:hypothetical protein
VRARDGNPFVISDGASVVQVDAGNYVVRAQDLPISEIYRFKMDEVGLCVQELGAGEKNVLVDGQPGGTPLQ